MSQHCTWRALIFKHLLDSLCFFLAEVQRKVNMYFLFKMSIIAIDKFFFFFASFHQFSFLKDEVPQEMHLVLENM